MVFLLAIGCLAMGGCLMSATSSTSYSGKGQFVGAETLEQIEPGKTTRAWVIAALGEPSSTGQADACEVLRYDYVKMTKNNATVFLLLCANDNKEQRQSLFFEIVGGVVQKHWRTSGE